MSADKTDKNLINNIMNYTSITIDGKKGNNLVYLTKGQFLFLLNEIHLQSKGYGFLKKGKGYDEYMDYWLNWPGTPIQ